MNSTSTRAAEGRDCLLCEGDVGDEAFCKKMVAEVLERFGRLDILVNNAAEQHPQDRIEDVSTEQLTKTFRTVAQLAAERGINVNAVAPGPIWTPLIPATFDAEELKDFGSKTLVGRPGQPCEVATCFVFLASDDSSFMTGQTLHPNGGDHFSS